MDRKRWLKQMDRRVIYLGGGAAVIYVVCIFLITFVPRTPQFGACMVAGLMPFLVLLGPMVIFGTVGLRKNRDDAVAYGMVNTLLVVFYGMICGLLLYVMIPRAD